jgi:shikimate kinase
VSDRCPIIGRSFVLVGLMGAGKTSIGRRLARRFGLPFVDADDEIALAAGMSIEDIFATLGEAAFRDGERRVIARLLAGPSQVLAAGGGAFLADETRALIRERAVSIWLRAGLDVLVARTQGRGGRPLLKGGDPRTTLAELMTVRHPVYAAADVTVDTGDEPPDVTTDRVVAALTAFAATAGQRLARE